MILMSRSSRRPSITLYTYIYVVHQATVYIQLTYVSSNFKSIFMLLYCPYSRHLGIWLCRKHTVNLHRLRDYTYIIDNMYSHDTYPAILLSFEHVQCFKYLNHGQYHNPVYTMDIVSWNWFESSLASMSKNSFILVKAPEYCSCRF